MTSDSTSTQAALQDREREREIKRCRGCGCLELEYCSMEDIKYRHIGHRRERGRREVVAFKEESVQLPRIPQERERERERERGQREKERDG